MREPTTWSSRCPGPANSVCFWRHTSARCTVSRPAIAAGTISTWSTNRRGMMESFGNGPPKTSDAAHVPTTGTDSAIE